MNMIEKIARAITDELGRQDGYDAPAWKFEDGLKLAYLEQGEVDMGLVARAALTAMLEPADAMAKLGMLKSSYYGLDSAMVGAEVIGTYRAMIQAALDEGRG